MTVLLSISHYREQFADAIRLGAMGYHFRKLTEIIVDKGTVTESHCPHN